MNVKKVRADRTRKGRKRGTRVRRESDIGQKRWKKRNPSPKRERYRTEKLEKEEPESEERAILDRKARKRGTRVRRESDIGQKSKKKRN
jgi:hypothetical protein